MSRPLLESDPRIDVAEFLRRFPDEREDHATVELIDGMVYVSPRPIARHQWVETVLGSRVGGPYSFDPGGPGGWWFLPEVDVQWSDHDWTVPDLAGWRRERMPEFPEHRPITLVPDWVCEILSPSTRQRDRTAKMEIHARNGVPHQWIIDPAARILEAYRNEAGKWLRIGAWRDGEVARVAPFDAVSLDIGELFPPRPPGPEGVAEEEAAWGP